MGKAFRLPSAGYVSCFDSGASNATSLVLDKDSNAIETSSFTYTLQNVAEVRVSKDNQCFVAQDGVLYDKNMVELIWYPPQKAKEVFSIPDTVTTIRKNAFFGTRLKRIKGGNAVTSIDPGFCSIQTRLSLKEIAIHNNKYTSKNGALFTIGMNELLFCPADCLCDLESDSLETICDHALAMNQRVTDVVLSDTLKVIDTGAFLGSEIVNLTGGYGLRSIGIGAFSNCKKLEMVVFQEGLISIGVGAFNNCQRLRELLIPKTVNSIGFSRDYSTISKKTTILCEKGSYAEKFASEHGYNFRLI